MSDLRTCRICDHDKPKTDFHSNGNGGLKGVCKQCDHWLQLDKRRQGEIRYARYRGWSALDDARLLALLAIGIKPKEASRIMGRSQTVVEYRVAALPSVYPNAKFSLPKRKLAPTSDLVEQVRSLRGVMSLRDGAAHLGLSSGQMAGIIHRYIRKGRPAQAVCGTTDLRS